MNLFMNEISKMCGRGDLPDNVRYADPAAPWNNHDESMIDQELVEEAINTARHLEELMDSIEDDQMIDTLKKLNEIIDILKGLREE